MRRPVRFVLAAGAVTVAAVVGGVLVLGDHEGSPAPARTPFSTTPLAGYDIAGVAVERGAFCDRVDHRQVTAALGGDAASSTSWSNGDPIELANGVQDVGHEFGCRWAGADGTVAQAWVFAPPVGADRARRLVRGAAKTPGCEPGDGPAFGEPTLALTCTTKAGEVRTSYRGLFGDGWLQCEVVRPPGATWDVTDRAGRWCVGVLEAARDQT
jgi:hypothetical protein